MMIVHIGIMALDIDFSDDLEDREDLGRKDIIRREK